MNCWKRLLGGTFLVLVTVFLAFNDGLAGEKDGANRAESIDASKLAQFIDQAVSNRLKDEGIPPSPPADDATFLRRAYLDIAGVIPPAEKVREFLDNKAPDKRAKAIDEAPGESSLRPSHG